MASIFVVGALAPDMSATGDEPAPSPTSPSPSTSPDGDAAPSGEGAAAGSADGAAAAEGAAGAPAKKQPIKRDRGRESKVKAAIVIAATVDDAAKREAAEKAILAADHVSRFYALAEHADHGRAPIRRYAWKGLVELGDPAGVDRLAKQFCYEQDKALRVELSRHVRALQSAVGAEAVGLAFAPYLGEDNPARRFRALQAMGVFRDRRVVRRVIHHMRLTIAGFQTATFRAVTQRAYIRNWRTISGGTGNTVIEVPDPEVDVVETGVSLEVKVRQIEVSMMAELLEDLTGQSYGHDVLAWERWLAEHPDFTLAEQRP